MTDHVQGLHHVTAIAGSAAGNLHFYRDALGLRFVKKTVNFDDPGTYHLYYGDEVGSAGTIMTFFPWEGIRQGAAGAGQVTLTQFAVPDGSLDFWRARLPGFGAVFVRDETLFDDARAIFTDPDGLAFALVERADARSPWLVSGVGSEVAIRGFTGVTLSVRDGSSTAAVLTEVFGYAAEGEDGATHRFRARSGAADVVDLHVDATMPLGREGSGSVHHVAFSVPDRTAQRAMKARMEAAGLRVTEQIDRDYFWAIYSRVPEGILFEVATDEPGFAVDEPVDELGTGLKLPKQHEPLRERIEAVLPALEG
ncbi:MAG: ring-cleaving dioxygenase [Pseudomonadota bacterium]